MSIVFSSMCFLIPLIFFWSNVHALLLSGLNDMIAGKTGFEGFESSGEASSYISRQGGSEASCCYTEVHAGSCSGSGSSKGTVCERILRRASCAKIIGWTPCWSHEAGWGSISWALVFQDFMYSYYEDAISGYSMLTLLSILCILKILSEDGAIVQEPLMKSKQSYKWGKKELWRGREQLPTPASNR